MVNKSDNVVIVQVCVVNSMVNWCDNMVVVQVCDKWYNIITSLGY